MRKLVLSMFMSLDGSITGRDGAFVGPDWSDDLETHWAGHALSRAGRLLFGRVNFAFLREFWEPGATDPSSPAAGMSETPIMNRLPKTVISGTLTGDPGWNATLGAGDLADVVAALKAMDEPGDIYCFGGAGVAKSLVARDLPDAYDVMITPKLMGGGTKLFGEGFSTLDLALDECRQLDTGAVILRYSRKR